jgi:hypothetical protein
VGEEITLMNWGNAFVTSAANGRAELKLHLEGDFKKTKKKVTRPHFRALFVFVFFLLLASLALFVISHQCSLAVDAGALDVIYRPRRRCAARAD